jgi:electron transfer flavoprotein beta subunit
MNPLVLLRTVRDPAGFTVNRKAQRIFNNRPGFILNPSDRNALEAALAAAGAEGQVTAVALGGQPAEEALRSARATGAARALQLVDAPALDPLAIATLLCQLVRHLGGVDLVLLGAEVLDADASQVPPRLAAALDWPFVDQVHQASLLTDGTIGLVVPSAGGFRQLGVHLPAIATVARDSNQPRFAPAARIITVFSDPAAVEKVSLADLGLDASALAPATLVRGESFPPERTLGATFSGADALQRFAAALRQS